MSPASADKFFTTGSTWEALYSYLGNFCFIDYTKAFDCVDHNKLWKILQKMGIPDHLTCLLRNLYAGQEATVRTGHGTTDWFLIGKGMRPGAAGRGGQWAGPGMVGVCFGGDSGVLERPGKSVGCVPL